jgi:hypothetical protein
LPIPTQKTAGKNALTAAPQIVNDWQHKPMILRRMRFNLYEGIRIA